jgi:hypothetical protein
LTDKLLHGNRDTKVILQEARQGAARSRVATEQPSIEHQRFLLDRQCVPLQLAACSAQIEQAMGEAIIPGLPPYGAFISQGNTVLLQGTAKERDQTVVKHVQKVVERTIMPMLEEPGGIVAWQHSFRAREPHKRYNHPEESILRYVDLMDSAGRKAGGQMDTKAHYFCLWIGKIANRLLVRKKPFEESYCLKQFVLIPCLLLKSL